MKKLNRFNVDNCPQHERLVKILTNAYNAGVDIELAFAEVQEKIRKRRWMDDGLRESRARHLDLNALVGKKYDALHPLIPLGDDHPSLWLDEHGNVVRYVSHLYELNHEAILGNAELCERLGLKMRISAADSWHCAGKTVLVELRKREPISVNKGKAKGGVTQ
ncbi:MAG: hypothetical protein GX971_07990 [Firmicutes bacterium]|nr:hypothetical protein [Bacillota bacterium]